MTFFNRTHWYVGSTTCPVGGECPPECDRTESGCLNVWGPESDHIEALRINQNYPACGGDAGQ